MNISITMYIPSFKLPLNHLYGSMYDKGEWKANMLMIKIPKSAKPLIKSIAFTRSFIETGCKSKIIPLNIHFLARCKQIQQPFFDRDAENRFYRFLIDSQLDAISLSHFHFNII